MLGAPPRVPGQAGVARPGQLLNDDEVAALLGAPLGQFVRSLQRQAPAPAGIEPREDAPPEASSPAAATASSPAGAQPERAKESPTMTTSGEPAHEPAPEPAREDAHRAPDAPDAADAANDDGPFVGEVDEIEPDDDAGLQDRHDEKPLSHGQAPAPPVESPKPDRDARAVSPSPIEQASAQAAQVLSAVLDDAVRRGASHVHLHSRRAGLALLIRQAGRLIDKPNFRRMEASQARALVGQLLDMAGLAGPWGSQAGADLSRPRSGEFTHSVAGRAVKMTLSSFPTTDGPRLVISLPARPQEQLDLAGLGARPDEAERIHRLLAARRGGLILVCGPTRHDRDDVLAALADQLAGMGRDVLAIGAGGSPVDPVGGYSFRDAARHLAGQDADAVVLAELRDPTSAAAAIEAALDGAMVIAGIAAGTAAEAMGMLAEMGVESWPLAAMLRGAIVCRKLPRQGLDRGTRAQDGNVRLISLLEPSRELVRLVRAAASAEAVAEAVPNAGPAALRDLAAAAVRDGYLSAEDAARLS
jgi:type II secretory ATPase GspE/PulE/Tfp pilus assembly ATPase PilB-like protein